MTTTVRPRRRHLALAIVLALPVLSGTGVAAAGDVSEGADHDRHRVDRCDRPVDQPADTSAKRDLDVDGRERSYILSLPRGYEKRDDWPVIVAFHGRASTGVEVEGYSDLSSLPAVVAYPNGIADPDDDPRHRQAWQGAPYAVEGVDDVAFTEAVLDDLQTDLCVDPGRTYATGKSNGGGFAALLSCRLPDRFAAVALVAPALYPQAREGCADAPAVPTLLVHGVADATVPFAGDTDRDLPAVTDWLAERAERDDCRRGPREGRIGRDVRTLTWSRCDDRSELRLLAVADGGHVWPGARVYSGGGHVTRTISAHQQAWAFFRTHELAAGGPHHEGTR